MVTFYALSAVDAQKLRDTQGVIFHESRLYRIGFMAKKALRNIFEYDCMSDAFRLHSVSYTARVVYISYDQACMILMCPTWECKYALLKSFDSE